MPKSGTVRMNARRTRLKEAGFVELKGVFVPEHLRDEIAAELRARFAEQYPPVPLGRPKK